MKRLILLSFFVLVFSSAFCSIQERFQDSLVNYFYFDEGAGGTASDIASGYLGSLRVSYNWVTGRLNKGLEFYGNNYVSVNAIPPELLGNANKTIAVWVYPTQFRNAIVYLGGTHGAGETFRLISDIDGFLGLNVSNGIAFSTIQLTLNDWNFIAALWDGSVYKVCSERRCERLYNLPRQNLYQGLYLIGKDNETNYFTRGVIDELYVFNASLTNAEVRELAGLYIGNISFAETEAEAVSALEYSLSNELEVEALLLNKSVINNTPVYYANITLLNSSNISSNIMYYSIFSAKTIYSAAHNASIELSFIYNNTNLASVISKENTSSIVLNYSIANASFETLSEFFDSTFSVELEEGCSNWTCSEYSICINDTEARICTEPICGFSRDESRTCERSSQTIQIKDLLVYAFGIIIPVIIIAIIVRNKNKRAINLIKPHNSPPVQPPSPPI